MNLPNPPQDRANDLCQKLAGERGETPAPTQAIKATLGVDQNVADGFLSRVVGRGPQTRGGGSDVRDGRTPQRTIGNAAVRGPQLGRQ